MVWNELQNCQAIFLHHDFWGPGSLKKALCNKKDKKQEGEKKQYNETEIKMCK